LDYGESYSNSCNRSKNDNILVAPELLDAVLLEEFLTNKNGNLASYVKIYLLLNLLTHSKPP